MLVRLNQRRCRLIACTMSSTELLDTHTVALADELVVRAFIDVLKSSPSTNVGDKNATEVRARTLHIVDQVQQPRSVPDVKSTFAVVTIGSNDLQFAFLSVCGDRGHLVCN